MSATFTQGSKEAGFNQATYTRLCNVVKTNNGKIEVNVENMSEISENAETFTLNSNAWKKFEHLLTSTSQISENTANHLKKLNSMFVKGNYDHLTEQHVVEELTTKFEQQLNNLKHVQQTACKIERRLIQDAKQKFIEEQNTGNNDHVSDSHGLTQEQQQLLLNQEDIQALQQRENELLALEESLMNVNEIFKDLQIMVADQGEVLDRIEDNVAEAEVQVEEGNTQLVGAREKQTSARKKKIFCGIILAVVVAIIIVAIIVSFNS